jgi:tRNA dimethylallyltransferase
LQKKILVVTGPTAAGKSSLITLATTLSSSLRIINADSKQVYREIPILTAQPVPRDDFFLYGHISAISESYSVIKWIHDLNIVTKNAWNERKVPLIVGGTPLYLYCLANGVNSLPDLDPNIVDYLKKKFVSLGKEDFINYIKSKYNINYGEKYNDYYRLIRDASYLKQTGKNINELYNENKILKLEYDSLDIIAFIPEREEIYNNINKRFLQMIDEGVIDEIQELMKYPAIYQKSEIMTIHGMREIINYLNKKISLNEMIETTQKNIRHYAKRQLTWFRNKFHDMKFFNCKDQILNYIAENY